MAARTVARTDALPTRRAVLAAALVPAAAAGCTLGSGEQDRPGPAAARSDLPQPRTGDALTAALAARRSVRTFTPAALTRAEIGQLLWAAQGVTHGPGYRTAPSAGALHPLELYVATRSATLRYVPDGHRVEERTPVRGWASLAASAASGDAVAQAPAVVLVAAVVRRTAAKYGSRADRYVALEAGHATQNLLLQATALGLGAVPLGAFDDAEVRDWFDLPVDRTPLYLVPVGRPAG